MGDIVDAGKDEQLSVQVDSPALVDGVAPGVLAAVVICVLCGIALLFSMAVFMDRWRNRKLQLEGAGRVLSAKSTSIPILDDMGENPTSEPPAAQASIPGTSSEC